MSEKAYILAGVLGGSVERAGAGGILCVCLCGPGVPALSASLRCRLDN